MKKNLIIVLLILVSVSSIFYAYIQSNKMKKVEIQIQELKQLVDERTKEAERQVEMSLQSAAEAKRLEAQALALKERLIACESK